ncbi:MAG: PilZ domain-containing protein [Candidatus Ancaeobacter aquaticus]|nr:PilZ domain-containing protein [Candidatus Ancaeobacter aquaticus]
MFKEKRKFARIPFGFVAKCRPARSGNKKQAIDEGAVKNVFGKDISSGGILIESDRCYPVSTLLKLELTIPSFEHPVNVTGRVVRIYEIDETHYEHGIVFENIEEKYKKTIDQFLALFSDAPMSRQTKNII